MTITMQDIRDMANNRLISAVVILDENSETGMTGTIYSDDMGNASFIREIANLNPFNLFKTAPMEELPDFMEEPFEKPSFTKVDSWYTVGGREAYVSSEDHWGGETVLVVGPDHFSVLKDLWFLPMA